MKLIDLTDFIQISAIRQATAKSHFCEFSFVKVAICSSFCTFSCSCNGVDVICCSSVHRLCSIIEYF